MRILVCLSAVSATLMAAPAVTFHKDVMPVLQRNCQGCHRPGETAPMTFLNYKETRPWAKAIKQAVQTKKMPPWFADSGVKFHNDRSLAKADLDVLVAWADTGAAEGNPKDAPAPVTFAEGWSMGKPDQVFEMPDAFNVPAEGTVAYQYVVLPTGFTEDKWVTAVEARPSNRAVNHHIIAFIREPGSNWLAGAKPGVIFTPDQLPRVEGQRRGGGGGGLFQAEYLVGYAPGTMPERYLPGQAKLIKAGSDLVLQLHYTATGKAGADRSKIGVKFATEKPKERVMTLAAAEGRFTIPAGADNHRVDAALTLQGDAKLIGLAPHMHVRGKAFEMRLAQPDGTKTELLHMRWDFNWQLFYELDQPLQLTKGSKIEASAWFDNSANNKFNPDPTKDVKWGDQSWEEMMIGFFNITFDASKDPQELLRPARKAPATPAAGLE